MSPTATAAFVVVSPFTGRRNTPSVWMVAFPSAFSSVSATPGSSPTTTGSPDRTSPPVPEPVRPDTSASNCRPRSYSRLVAMSATSLRGEAGRVLAHADRLEDLAELGLHVDLRLITAAQAADLPDTGLLRERGQVGPLVLDRGLDVLHQRRLVEGAVLVQG